MDRFHKDRRRAQAGTTLVELLVAITIIGTALVLIIGTLSTGLLDSTVAKRNASAQGVIQSELDRIRASTFNPSAQPYSDCFATVPPAPPASPVPPSPTAYQGSCGSGFSFRADVTVGAGPTSTTQTWTVTVFTVPDDVQSGQPVATVKSDR
jgi:type II secretory pathway pseudopilin PulG